ncbi:MAG: hypothetical protein ACT4NP_13625 [Pseudonocardiales bacterium]
MSAPSFAPRDITTAPSFAPRTVITAPSFAPRDITTAPSLAPPSLAPRAVVTVAALAPRAGVREWFSDQNRIAARIGLHLLLAGLPLLAISAQVFGLVSMNTTAALVIIPLAATLAVMAVFAPHPTDRIVGRGLVSGIVACVVYDIFRLDTVYMLGWWGDFIPTMGTWITDGTETRAGAVVGYLWRYVGDGGGIGIAFFVVALAVGLDRWSRRDVVLAAVAFAVFPVWTGLIATVALAPRGEELMFPLTATTVSLSLIGHLIFGLVLGLGFWSARGVGRYWPWPPLIPADRGPAVHGMSPATYEAWQQRLNTGPTRRVSKPRRPMHHHPKAAVIHSAPNRGFLPRAERYSAPNRGFGPSLEQPYSSTESTAIATKTSAR